MDLDNDGWLDLFLVNGHVYPEVERLKTEAGYKQRKVVYRNLGNGRFQDVSERLGPPITTPAAGRGAAFADLDNDGDIDVVVNNVNATPDLFMLAAPASAHWITLKLIGTRSNRSAIGARVRLVTTGAVQVQEVRGGAATTRRTICASTSGSARPRASIASRCDGRTGSKSSGPPRRLIGSRR